MKKINRIKLNVLTQKELQKREMNSLKGGENWCSCSCYYAGQGGSSTSDNGGANHQFGGHSTNGCGCYVVNPVYTGTVEGCANESSWGNG
jgi:natural product precursor